jgi:hypothetical protein
VSTDLKKHASIAAGEKPTRSALAAAFLSINDIIPVANGTEANQVAAALSSNGQNLATTPVFVSRADARGLHRVEYSFNGTVWLPYSGVLSFPSRAAADTWGSANSALLTVGDKAWVGNSELTWWGTAWGERALAIMRRTNAALVAPNGSYGDLSATAAWTSTGGDLRGCTYANGITVTLPGWYEAFWTVWMTGSVPKGLMGIAVNAATTPGGDSLYALGPIVSGVISTGSASSKVKLAAGDKLTLWGYGDGGTMTLRPTAAGTEPPQWGVRWIEP